MRKRVVVAMCTLAVCAAVFLCAGRANASEEFLNGDLLIKGFVKETVYYRTNYAPGEGHAHNSRIDYALTSGYFESIYKLHDSGGLTVTWFNGLKGWYEGTTSWDGQEHRYMAPDDRNRYQRPSHFEDVLTESYLGFSQGPVDVRVGKQIVIWGNLDVQRVADVVNPLDLRRGVPGVDSWEEVKTGLYMIRTIYRTSLPGNLIFENIINPGYYQNLQLAYEGTHWGPSHVSSQAFSPKSTSPGIYWWQQKQFNKDAPNGWNIDNWALGFRLMGYTWDVDWSLIYWNAKSQGPTFTAKRLTKYTLNYIFPGIGASINGGDVHPRHWNGDKICYYKRYQTFGGVMQTVWEKWRNSVWRLEWSYALDNPFNVGTNGETTGINGSKRCDVGVVALQYNDKWEIPWFTQSIARGSFLSTTLTYSWERIFNMPRDLCVGSGSGFYHRRADPNEQALSLFILQQMFNANWTLVVNSQYLPMIKKWFLCPAITYTWPGQHWRTDFGYIGYGGSNNDYSGDALAHKDSLLLRMRYEF